MDYERQNPSRGGNRSFRMICGTGIAGGVVVPGKARCCKTSPVRVGPQGRCTDSRGVMVFGAEVIVGYVFAWAAGKARRAGARADNHVDAAVDATVDRLTEKLHDLVAGKLHSDPVLERLTGEAHEGLPVPTERTRQRVMLALEDAAESDPDFAHAVEATLDELKAAAAAAGGLSAGAGGLVVGGSLQVKAEGGSIAAGVIHGGAVVGNPQVPGPSQS